MKIINALLLIGAFVFFSAVSFAQKDNPGQESYTHATSLEMIKYTVRSGDILSRIAKGFNVTIEEITNPEINPSLANRNPDLIFPGEIFNIPLYKPTASLAVPDDNELVQFSKQSIKETYLTALS